MQNNFHTRMTRWLAVFFWLTGAFVSTQAQNCETRFYTTPTGFFEDGSGAQNYANNLDCAYVIAPENAQTVTVNFGLFRLGIGDTVYVYNGQAESTSIIGVYTRNHAPGTFTANGGSVRIRLVTDGSSVADGFRVSYTSLNPGCDVPANLEVTNIQSTTATIFWDSDPDKLFYEIQFRPTFEIAWRQAPSIQNNLALITDMTPETEYEVRVRAVCRQDKEPTSWSEPVRFTTAEAQAVDPNICAVPQNLRAGVETISNQGNFVVVEWDNPAATNTNGNRVQAGIRYELRVRRSNRFNLNNEDWLVVESENPRVVFRDELSPNTAYDFQTRTICSESDTSDYSDIISFLTPGNLGPIESRVCLRTAANSYGPGEEFDVIVDIDEVNQYLLSVSMQLDYNTQYVDFVSATPGGFIPGATPAPVAVDENEGQINFALSSRDASTRNGGVLYTLRFRVADILPVNADLTFGLSNIRGINLGQQVVDLFPCPPLTVRAITNCEQAELNFDGTPELCQGESLSLKANADGGDYTYTWFRDGEQILQRNASVLEVRERGTYEVTIGIPGCFPSTSAPVDVTVHPRPILSARAVDASRFGNADGTLILQAFGARPPYTFNLEDTSFTAGESESVVLSGLRAGDYEIELIDAHGCEVTRVSQIFNTVGCPQATLTPAGTQQICAGSNIVLSTFADPEFEYEWIRNGVKIPGESGNALSVTREGNYTVRVTAPFCETSVSNTVRVDERYGLTLNGSTVKSIPNGATGQIIVSVSGGTGPYTYRLGGRSTYSFGAVNYENLPAGTYEVTVTDINGCSATRSFTVEVLRNTGVCQAPENLQVRNLGTPQPIATWDTDAGASCYIVAFGPRTLDPALWSQNTVPHPISNFRLTALPAGDYGIRIRSNCSFCSVRDGQLTDWSRTELFSINPGLRQGAEAAFGSSFKVRPNPNHGRFEVAFQSVSTEPVQLEVMDLMGRTIQSQTIETEAGAQTIALEVDNTGVYLVQLTQGTERWTEKVYVR